MRVFCAVYNRKENPNVSRRKSESKNKKIRIPSVFANGLRGAEFDSNAISEDSAAGEGNGKWKFSAKLVCKSVKNYVILVPTLDEQKEYLFFVQQVDKLEFDELGADQEARTFVSIKNICSDKIAYRMFD